MSFQQDTRYRQTERHRPAVIVGLVAAAMLAFAALYLIKNSKTEPTRKVHELQVVSIVPPPPPPPPPPREEPPEQEMIEQTPIIEPEIKPETPEETPQEEAPSEEPPGPLGLDQVGEGAGDAFNLAGRPGGTGLIGRGGGGSRWGWYASIVQTQIEEALRNNKKTRNAKLRFEVRLWSDESGQVRRVQLVTSTGSPDIDEVIQNDVLAVLKLREPPPKDMPMPIVTRITVQRPI